MEANASPMLVRRYPTPNASPVDGRRTSLGRQDSVCAHPTSSPTLQSWRGIKKTGENGLIGFLGTERTFLQDFPLSGYGPPTERCFLSTPSRNRLMYFLKVVSGGFLPVVSSHGGSCRRDLAGRLSAPAEGPPPARRADGLAAALALAARGAPCAVRRRSVRFSPRRRGP